jgi:hypothetical protein
VRGLLVWDEFGVSRVYVVCEPQVMTRSRWMPALVGELI